MNTYLFLWNPTRDVDSFSNYEKVQTDANSGRAYVTKWACPSKRPQPGDIAFMQRTDRINNGVFARGTVTKGTFDDAQGTRFVKLRLDSFLPLGFEISRESIKTRAEYQNAWGPQASGTLMPPEIAGALHALWKEVDTSPVGDENEVPAERVQSAISRIQRDTVATKALKSKYNYKCQICGIELPCGFEKRYIEVHHLKPLGHPHDGPDLESNMLVLCPNHHSLFDLGVPRFINATSLEINGENYKLTLKHRINEVHIAYYNRQFCQQAI